MDAGGEDDLFQELFGPSLASPPRPPPPRAAVVDFDAGSDDDFALPDTPSLPTPPTATGKSKPLTQAGGAAVDEEGGASGGGGAASAEPREADDRDDIKSKGKSKPKFDQTKLEDFPQVTNQKNSYWDSITPDQLVWCQDCPAIVVPERLHIFAKAKAPPDGVMAHGPSAKSVTPSRNRFAIVQFLPLCVTCHATPETPYMCVRGKHVESVLPYNTVMGGKKAGQDRALGPGDSWADADYHFRKAKGKSKQLTKQNWNVTLEHAQKFLSRALELRVKKAQEDEEESRKAEQELDLQRQQKELESEEAGESSAGEDGGEGDDDDTPKYTSKPVQMEKGLPLAPGDRIFYWDRTKVVGLASSRREATILEIRSKKAAKEANVELLVLDNHQVVMNDWVIQRYIKDEDTGEMQLDYRGAEVQHYKLKRGKLEGVDQRRHKRMEALVDDLRKSITEYGAGDQLRNAPKRRGCESGAGGGSDADDDANSSSQKKNKVEAKKAKMSTATAVAKVAGGGARSGAGGSGGDPRSVGRKESPLGEEDDGYAIAAAITKTRKRTKPKARVEPEDEQEPKGTGDNQEVEDVTEASIAKTTMRPKAWAEPEKKQKDATGSSQKKNKVEAKKAKMSTATAVAKVAGGGARSGAGGSGGDPRSVGRKESSLGEDDGYAIAAAITTARKRTKPKARVEPEDEQEPKGTDDNQEVEGVTEASIAKTTMRPKAWAEPEKEQKAKKKQEKGTDDQQEVEDVTASIAKGKKRTKPEAWAEPEKEQKAKKKQKKGTDDKQEVEDVTEASIAKAKGRMKSNAQAEPEKAQKAKEKQKGTDDQQEVEDVTEASIAKGKKETKPEARAKPEKEQKAKKKQEKGTDDKQDVEDVTEASIAKAKGRMKSKPENQHEVKKKQETMVKDMDHKREVVDVSEDAEGEGKRGGQRMSKAAPTAAAAAPGRGRHADDSCREGRTEKGDERDCQQIKKKRETGQEMEAQERAVGPSKKRSSGDGGKGGGDRNREAPAPKQGLLRRSGGSRSGGSRSGGSSSGNVDARTESKETKKRKDGPPALPAAASSGKATTGLGGYKIPKKPKLNPEPYWIPKKKKSPEQDGGSASVSEYPNPNKKQGGGSTYIEWRESEKTPRQGGGNTGGGGGGGGLSGLQRRHRSFSHEAARRTNFPKFKPPRQRAGPSDR